MKRKRMPGPKPRSSAAKALENPLFKPRAERPKKGKGSYARRPKHPAPGGFILRPVSPPAVLR